MADRDFAERLLRLDMAVTENGTPATAHFSQARARRGNTSKGIGDLIPGPGWNCDRSPLLWIADCILEPHAVARFFQFLAAGDLPGDRKTSYPLPTLKEVENIAKSPSEWAPAPFNQQTRSTCDWLMTRTGSYEDGDRLQVISKELHGMKMRIFEGFPPLSERRWKELELDSPGNFPLACRYIVSVINVFNYLNTLRVKNALRTTYNLMWGHLKEYEQALNAKRRLDSTNGIYTALSITDMWYQYIRAHYDSICEHAHRWVIQHIDRLRDSIVQELAHHYPPIPNQYSDKQWELTNKLHDLGENAAQADYTIFMPTDGYKGDSLPAKEREPLTAAHQGGFREEPIKWSANLKWRQNDYGKRVRYLQRKGEYDAYRRHGFAQLTPSVPVNDPASLLIVVLSQIDAQTQARQELRGLPQLPYMDLWIEYALQRQSHIHLGFVAYKLCHVYDSEIWDDFKAKFESDISDWGRDKTGIDDVRQLCKVHWIDGQENEIADGDIEAARIHFKTLNELPIQKQVFLAVDEAAMKSYLEPSDSNGKFLVAVDVWYKVSEEKNEESPGYRGTLRILGSLLWDELGAMSIRRSISLSSLWPMAMADPERIYRGQTVTPVFKFPTHAELSRWELACAIVPRLVALKRLVDSMPSNA
ncbi:hypothetical protein EDB81DRAFT_727286 [Dactylonectria macrodidyma]|uniref:Uncharacterized protein n=1 Tax=Dactylonectria macrodidyma TaxID=307937 RepID=A0A9P9EAA1_9HYPO|nr:hypothetical protein EDB81DRAFT_727286 [Dactylonectria macrodidyma]